MLERRSLRLVAVAGMIGALVSCSWLPLSPGGPGEKAKSFEKAAEPAATGSPAAAGGSDVPVAQQPPAPRGLLSDSQLGLLTANTGGALEGVVSGPDFLTANTGGALTANTGGALTANTGGALTANTGGALTANTGGAYRVSAASVRIANGFVYLTAPDERFYVTLDRRLYGTITDKDGNFALGRPATDSVVVNVLLKGNRRLTALALPGSGSVEVTLATTLVTEFLRAKSIQYGFTLSQVFASEAGMASLAKIQRLTERLFATEAVLSQIRPEDLTLNAVPVLRQRYAKAFGTSDDRALSDEWVAFLRAVLRDPASPDAKYRSLALTDVEAGLLPGFSTTAVAVATDSNTTFLYEYSRSGSNIRMLSPDGKPAVLISRARSRDAAPDALDYVQGMAVTPDGKLLVPDYNSGFIALLDPGKEVAGSAFDLGAGDGWLNPSLVVDTGALGEEGAAPADVALDDGGGLYLVDADAHVIWFLPAALPTADTESVTAPFAGASGEVPGATDPVPAMDLASLKLNQPSAITFHRRRSDGRPFLYVADNGDHVIVEIDLAARAARRVVGEVPPYSGGGERSALCYSPSEEGGSPLSAHLRLPQKMVFDGAERLVLVDGDNNLIRVADIYTEVPRIWTVAGIVQPDDEACGESRRLPAFVFGDGEARNVVIGSPFGIALDANGDLIITDDQSNRVRKLWLSRLK